MNNSKMSIDSRGHKRWFLNGVLHRTDGPAVERPDRGCKYWMQNGRYHRINGPAIEGTGTYKAWYLGGKYYGSGSIPSVEYTLVSLAYEGMSE